MRNIMLFLLIIMGLILSGCGKVELQNASIPLSVSADYQDNEIVTAIHLARNSTPEQSTDNGPQFTVLSSTGKTFSEAIRNSSLSLSTYPLWSHLELSVVGEKLAQTDLSLIMDFMARNRYVRKNILVVVTHNAAPEEVLSIQPILEPHTPTAIKHLLQIEESQMGIHTPVQFSELMQKFSSSGIEAVIPMITIDKSEPKAKLKLDGMAVFKGRKMIGSLDETESRGFRLMRPGMIEGGLFVMASPINNENLVTLELSRSQSKITPQLQDDKINMHIEINAEGNLYEQTGSDNLFTPQLFKLLEKSAEREMERQMNMCILKAQDLNSDILGWGQMLYRDDPELWKEIESQWDQIFPYIQADFKVNFAIRRSYLTDKAFVFQ